VESKYGTPFLQGRHLPFMRIHDLKYISNVNTRRMEKWIIEKGWVLVTRSGTIGRIALSTNGQDGWAASEHILRIVPRFGVSHPGFLAAFLSTPFGQHQLKAKIYGGVVDELTVEDTKSVWIPDVPYEEQEMIGQPFVEAYELRDTANSLEDKAIMTVEKLIAGQEITMK
jgi:type I restriction enzyme S subunit